MLKQRKNYLSLFLLLSLCMPAYMQQEESVDESAPAQLVQAEQNVAPERVSHVINHGQWTNGLTQEEEKQKEMQIEAKRKTIVDLVGLGIEHLSKNPLDEALSAISHSPEFRVGELYLFIYDIHGVCFAHGHHENLIWSDLWEMRDEFGILIVQEIIKKANQGGGWITYSWRNATKVSYVQKVSIDGKEYVVGSGYYPHSKRDSVVSLVKGAVAQFNQAMAQGQGAESVFGDFSYPLGQFVLGDLYLYALDFDGTIVAQGDSPGLIGNTAWDATDAKGLKLNQVIIQNLQEAQSTWIEYISKGAPKRAYAEKVTDRRGKRYFIACGYYPDTNRKQAVDLLRKGYKFLKTNGLSATKDSITNLYDKQFSFGDLYLVLYSKTGECLAHGNNAALVGSNFWDARDQDGKYYVQAMIKKALDEPGWVDFKSRNLFKSTYVEKVELGTDTYILTCGLYPVSKRESAILLVKTAGDHLETVDREVAFRDFTRPDGKYIRGDLHIFVLDVNGYCYVYGDSYNLIWRNLLNVKDDAGKEYVRLLINTSKNGPGQVSFTVNRATKIGYVEQFEKDGKSYVVGSGYYE